MKIYAITRQKREEERGSHVLEMFGTDLKLKFSQAVELTLATNLPQGGFFVRPFFDPDGIPDAWYGENSIHIGTEEACHLFGALGLPQAQAESFFRVCQRQGDLIEYASGGDCLMVRFLHITIGIESNGYAHS